MFHLRLSFHEYENQKNYQWNGKNGMNKNVGDDDVRNFWDQVSSDWEAQVGDKGDSNRLLNSDPVLWKLVGAVRGLNVLDAGCGTGYLSRKLCDRGASVIGIDLSSKMIEIARQKNPEMDFRIDSCSELRTLDACCFDMVVSNYVLMDLRDLHGAMKSFHRVLKPEGVAVLVFSHPCFPQARAAVNDQDGTVTYVWDYNYFEEARQVSPAWGHFKSEFIWFHRPLSAYWKAFRSAGFEIADFNEPSLARERYHLAANKRQLSNGKSRPYSVAFKLKKTGVVK
jgi:ubiquinone/menaquinone biosynthesis C-methylase UbiE